MAKSYSESLAHDTRGAGQEHQISAMRGDSILEPGPSGFTPLEDFGKPRESPPNAGPRDAPIPPNTAAKKALSPV